MYCIKCGKQIADDSKFCEFCGAPQDGGVADAVKTAGDAVSNTITEAEAVIAEAAAKADDIQDFLSKEKTPEAPDLSGVYKQAQTSYQSDNTASQTSYQSSYQQPQAAPYQPAQGQGYQPNQGAYQPGQAQGTAYQPGYYNPAPKKKTWPIIVIALVIVAVLAAVIIPRIGGGGSSVMKNPEDVIETYFKKVEKSDLDGIISLMPEKWYDYLHGKYPTSQEFWNECDYCYENGMMGWKMKDYEYEVYEEFTSDSIANINSQLGLDFDTITTYSVYVYFTNGNSDLVYIDMGTVGGRYYFIECW
ncbi:MAG: zinc-ribbon domain-containing protein [Eubacteriaceae bacterium]|nr:zinc-ribbon domain-containing protein [Eubacteriaceae bacterium]